MDHAYTDGRLDDLCDCRWASGGAVEHVWWKGHRGHSPCFHGGHSRAAALLLILIVYYALPTIGLNLPRFPAAVVSLAVCYAAYIAEVFRAAVESIPKGQSEAAFSLGMNRAQALRHVILPQTFRRVLPPLANEFAALIKDTSLVSVIAMQDLLFNAKIIGARTANFLSPLIGAALIYLIMTTPVMQWSRNLEKKVE